MAYRHRGEARKRVDTLPQHFRRSFLFRHLGLPETSYLLLSNQICISSLYRFWPPVSGNQIFRQRRKESNYCTTNSRYTQNTQTHTQTCTNSIQPLQIANIPGKQELGKRMDSFHFVSYALRLCLAAISLWFEVRRSK